MNLQLDKYIPWFGTNQNKDMDTSSSSSPLMSTTTALLDPPKPNSNTIDPKFWKWSLFSLIPWAVKTGDRLPTTVNRGLKKRAQPRRGIENVPSVRFRPYVSKVPWHTGPRGFLSQMFPRYGHYCGPNWSSGRDNGSPIWDRRPMDWLDFCCYCHDMGYDTHDQAELLKADLAFLECLERPNMTTKGDPMAAFVYKLMCTSGLRNFLIPYRQSLVKLQSGKLYVPLDWLSNMKWKGWNLAKN